MFRGSIIFRVLASLLLVGALVAAGIMLFQAGQAQGYAMGLAADGKTISPPAGPGMMVPGYGYGFGYWRPHFFPFGLFFCLIPLLFFFLFGGLFRAFAWRMHPGPWGYGPEGQGHWDPHHWHTHPQNPQPEGSKPAPEQPAENK